MLSITRRRDVTDVQKRATPCQKLESDRPPELVEKCSDRVREGQRRSNAFPDAYAQPATAAASSLQRVGGLYPELAETLPRGSTDGLGFGRSSGACFRFRLCLHLFYPSTSPSLFPYKQLLLFPSFLTERPQCCVARHNACHGGRLRSSSHAV